MKPGSKITLEFLEKTLKKNVESFTVTPGSKPGDNFTSIMIAVDVTLKNEQKPIHLLLKMYPEHPIRQKFLDDTNCFLKELLVYNMFITELTEFQKEIGIEIGETIKLAVPPLVCGRAFDYENSELNNNDEIDEDDPMKNYLMMVDIRKTWGFKLVDNKFVGLDYHHCKLVMIELAKFHAVSWVYKDKKGLKCLKEKFPFLIDILFCEKQRSTIEAMIQGNFSRILKILDEAFGSDNKFFKALQRFEKDAADILLRFLDTEGPLDAEMEKLLRVKPSEEKEKLPARWIIGGHGDCHLSNMLFRYDETSRKPVETILVDLQLARESCPVADLAYFFYSSTFTQLRKDHMNELLDIYHAKFLSVCSTLKSDILPGFTLSNFKRRFQQAKIYGLIIAIMVQPIILQKHGVIDWDTQEIPEDSNISDFVVTTEWDEDEKKTLQHRFMNLAQELYEEGVI